LLVSRRLAKLVLVLLAVGVLALALSACAFYKAGSLQLSQPAGIGSVRVHFALCTEPENGTCGPDEGEEDIQYIVGIAVPKGSAPPATITATATDGGPSIVFSRNDQAAQSIASASAQSEESWPPAGSDGIGYLSAPHAEEEGVVHEWVVDADFGLPAAADGGSFTGPFDTAIAFGARLVNGSQPADRPVRCFDPEAEGAPEEDQAFCGLVEEGSVGTSDLKIPAPTQSSVYVGGNAAITFPLDFGSTATTLPSFNLAATSTLPGATLGLLSTTFAPGAPPSATHRLGDGSTVNVTVPKTAKPGVYDVTLTATTAQGGTVSQVAKLQVIKPKLKFGKVKLNKAKGTAIVFVKVPAAGTLTASGKGIAKAKRKAKGPKTLKLPIKPKAKAKGLLATDGKAKVKAKITFKPSNGAPVTKTKNITLKKNL
jgi:hypothetical protein